MAVVSSLVVVALAVLDSYFDRNSVDIHSAMVVEAFLGEEEGHPLMEVVTEAVAALVAMAEVELKMMVELVEPSVPKEFNKKLLTKTNKRKIENFQFYHQRWWRRHHLSHLTVTVTVTHWH